MTYIEKYGCPIKSVDYQDDNSYVTVVYLDGRIIQEFDTGKIHEQLHAQVKAIANGEDLGGWSHQ